MKRNPPNQNTTSMVVGCASLHPPYELYGLTDEEIRIVAEATGR